MIRNLQIEPGTNSGWEMGGDLYFPARDAIGSLAVVISCADWQKLQAEATERSKTDPVTALAHAASRQAAVRHIFHDRVVVVRL